MIGNLGVTTWKFLLLKNVFFTKKTTRAEMWISVLRYSFAFNSFALSRAQWDELFSNICLLSLENVGFGSYDGSKYLNYSNFYNKVQSIIK
jgi:hypothetical protein